MLDINAVAKELLGIDVKVAEEDLVGITNEVQVLLVKYSDVIKNKYPNKDAILNKLAEILAKTISDDQFTSIIISKLPVYLKWLSFIVKPLLTMAKTAIIKEILSIAEQNILNKVWK